jgi:hypothetical protein
MKNKKKLYKVLVNGKSCHGGDLVWSLPQGKKPGKWHTVEGDLKICQKGIHVTTERFSWYKWGCEVYEAEAKDIIEWEEDKCVARSVRLIKKVPHPKWWTDAEGWIATLRDIAWLKPDGKPNKEWKVFPTRAAAWDATWAAARAAARDVARDAARAAAWSAAWSATRAAARAAAWTAAGDAAGDAAWSVAWSVAGAAAGAAAGDAAGDAALYVRGEYICKDLKLAEKHHTHIRKRMEVWQKGYGLLCDVSGVLYVYEKI